MRILPSLRKVKLGEEAILLLDLSVICFVRSHLFFLFNVHLNCREKTVQEIVRKE